MDDSANWVVVDGHKLFTRDHPAEWICKTCDWRLRGNVTALELCTDCRDDGQLGVHYYEFVPDLSDFEAET